jgi:hypothetical protein
MHFCSHKLNSQISFGIGSWSLDFDLLGVWSQLRQCLVPSKFQKFYKILRHIKSLDICMEH